MQMLDVNSEKYSTWGETIEKKKKKKKNKRKEREEWEIFFPEECATRPFQRHPLQLLATPPSTPINWNYWRGSPQHITGSLARYRSVHPLSASFSRLFFFFSHFQQALRSFFFFFNHCQKWEREKEREKGISGSRNYDSLRVRFGTRSMVCNLR